MVNIPAVVLGAVLGVLTTGFAFAVTTGQRIAIMGAEMMAIRGEIKTLQEQFREVAEWRLKTRGT